MLYYHPEMQSFCYSRGLKYYHDNLNRLCMLWTRRSGLCSQVAFLSVHCMYVLTYLVFVQLTVLILLFSLLLEGDDYKAHKYIHHKEGDKDEVDDEED